MAFVIILPTAYDRSVNHPHPFCVPYAWTLRWFIYSWFCCLLCLCLRLFSFGFRHFGEEEEQNGKHKRGSWWVPFSSLAWHNTKLQQLQWSCFKSNTILVNVWNVIYFRLTLRFWFMLIYILIGLLFTTIWSTNLKTLFMDTFLQGN